VLSSWALYVYLRSLCLPSFSIRFVTLAPQPSEPRTARFDPDDGASVVVRRRVEELVRSLEELKEDKEGSDTSFDLFELESLRDAGADELRKYGKPDSWPTALSSPRRSRERKKRGKKKRMTWGSIYNG
jgi:hypothetical protein